MLQQTQVPRVLQKYPRFLEKYPTFTSLADAPSDEVLRDWEGMGYNNRILRLKKLASMVRDTPFPKEPERLERMEGIGPYTAHAVACFAFEQDVPVVDVNIRRIFSRMFFEQEYLEDIRSEKEMWELAKFLVPEGKGYDWNQALMDFGSLICTARAPRCEDCVLFTQCASSGIQKSRPKEKKAQKGIPDRIYRGKVVQHLRKCHGWVSESDVISSVRADASDQWWETLLSKLHKEGLIKREKRHLRL
jgi:A/G-specific adenine glycosylase